MRIAVLKKDRCQPKKCSRECLKYCPMLKTGKEAIVFSDDEKRPIIKENLCSGCGLCVKKCPFGAIGIVSLPDEYDKFKIHQYGINGFRLYRIPYLREGMALGIVGQNALGKTTLLKIFSGEIIPNFGRNSSDKNNVLKTFKNTQLYDYFNNLYKGKIKVVHKIQHVDLIRKYVKGKVKDVLERLGGNVDKVVEKLELKNVMERDVTILSGGELQRLAIAACLLKDYDVYIFDEPCSYLDVSQRLKIAKIIRELLKDEKTVIVVEHDLIFLDYIADNVVILYGKPGVYGIVSNPKSTREGINMYLEGYIKDENVRFRDAAIRFFERKDLREEKPEIYLRYTKIKKSYDGFSLEAESGEFHKGEIIGILGPNSIGKTTFVRILAGELKQDFGDIERKASVSYKPQYIKLDSDLTVEEFFKKIPKDELFHTEIYKQLGIEDIRFKILRNLSGGELQRVAIAACLSKPADIYLIDEPSAYLDVEQRLNVAKIIRRIIEKRKALCFVVDHDLILIDYVSDKLIVFTGEPERRGYASKPLSMREGMNIFLKTLDITFRRDKDTKRPRVNKPGSKMDRYQKKLGEYYYV